MFDQLARPILAPGTRCKAASGGLTTRVCLPRNGTKCIVRMFPSTHLLGRQCFPARCNEALPLKSSSSTYLAHKQLCALLNRAERHLVWQPLLAGPEGKERTGTMQRSAELVNASLRCACYNSRVAVQLQLLQQERVPASSSNS